MLPAKESHLKGGKLVKEKSQTDEPNTYNIQIIGEITDECVCKAFENIDIANAKNYVDEIHISLCSYGGDVLLGIALFDHIKRSKKPITITAEGVCMSIAVTILQAATLRQATTHTLFMVHPSISSLEERSYPEFISMVDQYKKNHDLFVKLTIEKSGMTREEFETIYNPRKYLTPEEALHFGKNGLIDKII